MQRFNRPSMLAVAVGLSLWSGSARAEALDQAVADVGAATPAGDVEAGEPVPARVSILFSAGALAAATIDLSATAASAGVSTAAAFAQAEVVAPGDQEIADGTAYLNNTGSDGTLVGDSYPALSWGQKLWTKVKGFDYKWAAISVMFSACVLNPACAPILLAAYTGTMIGLNARYVADNNLTTILRDRIDEMFPGLLPAGITGLPSAFSGSINGPDGLVTYSGTRSGNIVQGGYTSPDASGAFTGVLSRNFRVNGRYSEPEERGVFGGRVTRDLSEAFGNARCTSGCDD